MRLAYRPFYDHLTDETARPNAPVGAVAGGGRSGPAAVAAIPRARTPRPMSGPLPTQTGRTAFTALRAWPWVAERPEVAGSQAPHAIRGPVASLLLMQASREHRMRVAAPRPRRRSVLTTTAPSSPRRARRANSRPVRASSSARQPPEDRAGGGADFADQGRPVASRARGRSA